MNTKMNFPRLKAYSNLTQPTKSTKQHTSKLRISTIQSQKFIQTNHLSQKLNCIKLKYINKSPTYFKNKFRSIEVLDTYKLYDKSVEDYLEEQSKVFDKESLLELTKKRMRKINMTEKMRKKQLKQSQQKPANLLDQLHLMKQSQYQNFRPLKIPINHLKYALKSFKHPNLTIEYS